MAIANTPTLLSLDRFAYTLGLSPAHFNGGKADPVFPITRDCGDIWVQFPWQSTNGLVSRDEIAQTIRVVEDELKNLIGYSLAPQWETSEYHEYPHKTIGPKQMKTDWGHLIAPGQRAAELIEAGATVVYSDADGDGYSELATITVATSVENRQEIKIFYPGEDADPEWEIRHLKDVVLSGGNATITLYSWQLVDPDLWEELPTSDDNEPIDLTAAGNLVSTVDVYRVYNDSALTPVTFHSYASFSAAYSYFPFCSNCFGAGCEVCSPVEQTGCFQIIDRRKGYIMPFPATLSEGQWTAASFENSIAPAEIEMNYYAGYTDPRFIRDRTLDPLSQFFAEVITYMTVARLPKRICGCPNVSEWASHLQRDLSVLRDSSNVYARFDRMDIFSSPIGTRVGEVMAWQRLGRILQDTVMAGGAL